jgi:hypothetical protein
MATTILIVCFSAVVIALLTILLIRSTQDSEKRETRILTSLEKQTDTLESIVRLQNVTTQTTSSDTADLVKNLVLGREEQYSKLLEQRNEEQERQPIPGLDTYEGLPQSMAEVLERERQEEREPREWRVVLPTPSNGSEQPQPSPSPTANDETLL